MSVEAGVRVALLALVLAGGSPPARLDAQVPGERGAAGLGVVAARVAQAWSAGDLAALRILFAADGVRIRDQAGEHGRLDPRKAAAVLRELWARHRGGRVRVERSSIVGGTPARGFAHLGWTTVPRGTSEPVSYTLFVGMVQGAPGWRIYEIRILR